MKCPLLMAGWFVNNPIDVDFSVTECFEDGCAWWDTWDSCCAIMAINKELSRICSAMDNNLKFDNLTGKPAFEED